RRTAPDALALLPPPPLPPLRSRADRADPDATRPRRAVLRPLALRRAASRPAPRERNQTGRRVDAAAGLATPRRNVRCVAGAGEGRRSEPHRLLQGAGSLPGGIARRGAGGRGGGPPLGGK